ncbi:MAG: adenylate/guanylate cyclase domain-containing protein, partial [Chloroflexota bacterium]
VAEPPPQVAPAVSQPAPVIEAPPQAAAPVSPPAPVAEPPPQVAPAARPPMAAAAPPRTSSTPPPAAPAPAASPEPPPRRAASPPSGARTTVTQKDERRLVTVLFGDVSGFTAMSEKLDPEDMKTIMDNCLKMLADQVAKFDGNVDKFEGDLIMAVWGAPTAHEDDAERAVMAAMGMQEGLHAFSDRLERQRGFTLKMRIGLNSGEVISGAVASGRSKDYTVMGDVVNTASRFESNAEPGTVMVGASTHALTKHMFDYETLEPIKVKGKVEPLAVYRPVAIRSVRGQRRGVDGLASPMVGRGHAFEALTEAFDEAASTHVPQLVTITGIPGIGKSRLVDEFERYLTERGTGAGWCKGRCLPYGQGIAFHPLAEMLKGLFGITDSDAKQAMLDRLLGGVREVMENVAGGEIASSELDEEARQICHRLGYAMGVAYPDSDLSEITPANVKDELLWAWRRFFYYWAGAAPAVIVVEDLQWGDRIVVDLLESLLDVLEDVPIMIVACARPELVEQSLSLVEGLNRKIIELDHLDTGESRELLDNLLSPNLLSRSWKERVVTAAGGVPFFLEEVLRGLVEEGRIVQSPAGWAPVQAENLPDLPVTVFATLFARMDRLPSLEKAVLQRASVVGSRFWDTALSYPAPQLGREGAALLGLQAKNWVAQQNRSSFVDDREYLFTNDLVRESAYKVLTKI